MLSLVHTRVREIIYLILVRSFVSQNGDNKWGISYSLRSVVSAPAPHLPPSPLVQLLDQSVNAEMAQGDELLSESKNGASGHFPVRWMISAEIDVIV